jgi:hypothetical protein
MNLRFWTWFRKARPEPVPVECQRRAVLVGLDRVDPAGYDGWTGECPGAVLDVSRALSLLTAAGVSCTARVNRLATWPGTVQVVRDQARDLGPADLLVLWFSGHGWRLPDPDMAELDGMNEGLCFYDRRVVDDEILDLLLILPPCRIAIISDHCHAAADALPRSIRPARPWTLPVRRLLQRRSAWAGQIIQFAGSRTDRYAYGSDDGGTWTSALLAAFDPALTWREWFKATARRMPASQPVELVSWQEHGFLDRRALT